MKKLSLLLLLTACEPAEKATNSASSSNAEIPPTVLYEAPADRSKLLENLPGSTYDFPVHVVGVQFQTVKKAFVSRASPYSKPIYSDGKRLVFSFDMTNPYDEPMQAPIPDDFRLQGNCFSDGESGSIVFDRISKRYVLMGGQVSYKGKRIEDVPGAERPDMDYLLPFKPHQTRRFNVRFEQPFDAQCPGVTLLGFTRLNRRGYDSVETGLSLDVTTGRVTEQLFRKHGEDF